MSERNDDPTLMSQNSDDVTLTKEMTLDDSAILCPAILDTINSLRQEGNLCDASLVIGEKKILVHKCILVGGSDYFRSRFIGPLKGDNPEVDLSSVTSDANSVEAVVNYLYTGKITLDDENLEAVMKLSSYLLITKLQQFCVKYMLERVQSGTTLQYYLLAVEYDIKEVVDKLALTVKSRFHDSIIFDSILSVSPNQLLFLVNELNIFEHCNVIDTLYVILNWMESGMTEAHELLACDILDFVIEKEKNAVDNIHLYEYVKEYFEEVQKMAKKVTVNSQLRSKLNKAVKICSDLLERFPKRMSLRPLQSRAHPCSLDPSEKEDVLIVMSPNQRFKDLRNLSGIVPDGEDIPDGTSIYDVCVYTPKTQTWCYMGEGVTEEFNLMRLFTSIILFPYKVCFFANALCVAWPLLRFIYIMNIADFQWRVVDLSPILPIPDSLEECCYRYLISTDDTLYLILQIRVYLPNEPVSPAHIYLRCYRLTSENTWSHVFDTPGIDTQRRTDFEELSAAVSAVNNQMIIVHNGTKLHAFVADLSVTESSAIEVQMFCKENDIPVREHVSHVHILETKSHFHLLIAVFLRDENRALVCYRYKYQFSSKELETIEDCEVTIKDFPVEDPPLMAPCLVRDTTNGKQSMWMFGGTAEHGSCLVEISIDDDGKLVQCKHKPPPFSCVSVMVVGRLSSQLLASRCPIFQYLTA